MEAQAEIISSHLLDQNEYIPGTEDLLERAQHLGETILKISQLVIDFADIKRAPRYCEGRRENDAEHSFMLALVGIEIAHQDRPDLNRGLVGELALVHDLIEVKTGDMPTFQATEEQLRQKHAREQAELPGLLEELPPHLAELLKLYEAQKLPETVFLKNLDKLLPYPVDIIGAGEKVMHEDFGITTRQEFLDQDAVLEQRWRNKFPSPKHDVLHAAHRWLGQQFAVKLPDA